MKKPLEERKTQETLVESVRATFQGLVLDHEIVRGTFSLIPMVQTSDGMISLVEFRFVIIKKEPKKSLILAPPLPGENSR
jgi:hypothetical protein